MNRALDLRVASAATLVALFAALLPSTGSASAATTSPDPASSTPGSFIPTWIAREAIEQGAPRQLIDRLLAEPKPVNRAILSFPWGDLSGNGLDDVLVIDLEFVQGVALFNGSLTLTARDGRTGRQLWRTTERFVEGFALPIPARVGPKGRDGAIIYKVEAPQQVGVVGISSKGKRVYEYSRGLTEEDDLIPVALLQDLVSLDFFNGVKGRATDVLLGVARTPAVTPTGRAEPYETKTLVLDGRNGEVTTHLETELALGAPAVPRAGPDLDGDGLEDVVVLNVLPDIEPGPQGGAPELPSPDSHYVRGRRGHDGRILWTSDPVDLGSTSTRVGPFSFSRVSPVWVQDGGDLTGTKRRDVLLDLVESDGETLASSVIHVLDGQAGVHAWSGSGELSVPVADIDRDGKGDVFTATGLHSDDKASLRLIAFSGRDGERLYHRKYKVKGVRGEGSTALSLWPIGDVEPDGVTEMLVSYTWFDTESNRYSQRELLASARTGKPHRLSLKAGEALLGPVDGRGDDVAGLADGRVFVLDGRSRDPLLRFELGSTLGPSGQDGVSVLTASRVDGDRCADLVGNFSDGRNLFTFVVDGGSGTLAWSNSEYGSALASSRLIQLWRADSNSAC